MSVVTLAPAELNGRARGTRWKWLGWGFDALGGRFSWIILRRGFWDTIEKIWNFPRVRGEHDI